MRREDLNRSEACGILDELASCWKESNGGDSERIVTLCQAMGMEFGLRLALNYPEYTVALRDALDNCESQGDGSKERFLTAAAKIIAAHPIEIRA